MSFTARRGCYEQRQVLEVRRPAAPRARAPTSRRSCASTRLYPWVKTYSAWNEVNHVSQPTAKSPKLAARYYNVLRNYTKSRKFKLVAADVLDSSNVASYLRSFLRSAKGSPRLWGVHNYADVNRKRSRGTRAVLKTVPGEVWMTETGGILQFAPDFPRSESRAASRAAYTFSLASTYSKRRSGYRSKITRLYYYQYTGADSSARFDAGLVNPDGTPRKAYDTFLSKAPPPLALSEPTPFAASPPIHSAVRSRNTGLAARSGSRARSTASAESRGRADARQRLAHRRGAVVAHGVAAQVQHPGGHDERHPARLGAGRQPLAGDRQQSRGQLLRPVHRDLREPVAHARVREALVERRHVARHAQLRRERRRHVLVDQPAQGAGDRVVAHRLVDRARAREQPEVGEHQVRAVEQPQLELLVRRRVGDHLRARALPGRPRPGEAVLDHPLVERLGRPRRRGPRARSAARPSPGRRPWSPA